MAEQAEPVRRRVAFKIIKPGMDTKEVIARFEAERQAPALMDHPNIAKAFDGGATETSRPCFVMDLVKGVPLIRFCDEGRLSLRERLAEENTLKSLREAARLSPTNGLACARLARQILAQSDQADPRRLGEADYYSRYALKWLPNDDEMAKIRAEIEAEIKNQKK